MTRFYRQDANPNDLVALLHDGLPDGDYAILIVAGEEGDDWLASQPPMPRMCELESLDGSERVWVFEAGAPYPPPGHRIEIADGVVMGGIRIVH